MKSKSLSDEQFMAQLKALGLNPKTVAAETERVLKQIMIIMLGYDSRISMTAAFIALACFLTQRVPDEITEEFTVIYKELIDRMTPLRLTQADNKLLNMPVAGDRKH